MKLHITILLLALAIIFVKGEKRQQSSQDAVVKSSVTKKPMKDEAAKVDKETKEQLEEADNDDKELEKQEKEVKNKQNDQDVEVNDSQDSDDGSGEESEVDNENEAENDDAAEADDATIKRAEESKNKKDDKKGKKFVAYPLFYPGDYFGGLYGGHGLGGPAGFHPGSIWEYPYPYVHPMYPSPFYPCQCKCKDDKEKEEDKKEKDKKTRRKQLVPSHYYGPPSAGWGAYQPGHTGAGWGAPYWYKSYIPSTQQKAQTSKEEGGQTRHTIHDGLDFGISHAHDSAHVSYGGGHDDLAYGLGDTFGAGWHDGYTEHPVYGTYGGGAGRTTFVDPVYGDLENTGLNGWGHGVGRPYLPHDGQVDGYGIGGQGYGDNGYGGHGYGGHGYGSHGYGGHGFGGHGHGYAEAVGHPYLPTHEGLNEGPVHHGETFFGPHTAMLPTAQGHIQVASAGHAVGMGGHNLGGFSDKEYSSHNTEGDFVGGIHADLGSHDITGHHHDHAAAGHTNAPLLHTGSGGGFKSDIEDHFGAFPENHGGHAYLGMNDHFGPILEHEGGHGHTAGGHGHAAGGHGLGIGGHDMLHGHHGGHHGINNRIYHDFGAHAGHGGAFDGHIGDSVSASHLFGGVHKSGVPPKHKAIRKIKAKSRQHKKKAKHQ